MTLIEVILSAALVGMLILQGVILLELRDSRVMRRLRESVRRGWKRDE